MLRYKLFISFLFLTALPHALFAQELIWQRQESGTKASLRGLHVVNDQVIWASGAKGSLLRSMDGGTNWQQITPPDSLDFRSIWAFNEQEAIIASAGQPARVYSTSDGGVTWQLVLEDSTGKAFFDALAFWDTSHGLLLSDPIEGKGILFATKDKGKSWQQLFFPAPEKGEAYFAASNSSIALQGERQAWIGSGGSAVAVMKTNDAGKTWQRTTVPMPLFSEAAGLYALVFADKKSGVAVGGAYNLAEDGTYAAYYTTDGGKSWQKAIAPPSGYRSGVAYLPGSRTFVAVGTNGSDMSTDGGIHWQKLNQENLNSIRFSPSARRGWAVGAQGRIFMIAVKKGSGKNN